MPIADPDRAPFRARSARCTVRGSILLVALLILVLVGAIAVGAVSLVGSGTSASADRVQSEQALFAAESGIRRMVSGEPACDGSTHAVGNAWFNCDPAPGECDADRSLVQGWVGSPSPDGAPALHQICVVLLGAGLPPCDDAAWECVQDADDISPGGGGKTYENLYVAEGISVIGAGNWTVQGDACFSEGVSVSGGITFEGNVYWEGDENTSGQASTYEGCVYESGVLNETLSGGADCETAVSPWCPEAGDGGGSGWGYSGG